MADPAQGFKADRGLAERLRQTPYARRQLEDRDGFRLTPIETGRDPEIWHMPSNAVVRTWRKGDEVTRVEILEGDAGWKAWLKYAMHLTPERKAEIEAAFAEHDTLDAAFDAAFGSRRAGLSSAHERRDGDGTKRMYGISESRPKRQATLEVTLDADGALIDHRLYEGEAAWKAGAPYREAAKGT